MNVRMSLTKRVLAVAMTATCAFGVAACGSDSDDAAQSSTSAISQAEEVAGEVQAEESAEEPAEPQYDQWDENVLGVDMNGRAVDMNNAEYAGHTPEEIQQVTDYGENTEFMEIDEVGLHVPLGTMNSYRGVIEPVGFTHAYIVGDFSPGYHDPASGSILVVAHALDGEGQAPGNFVWDSATRTPKVGNGAVIRLGDRSYTINNVQAVPKTELVNNEELWSQTPATLHFVTCVPNQNDNLVITATLNP